MVLLIHKQLKKYAKYNKLRFWKSQWASEWNTDVISHSKFLRFFWVCRKVGFCNWKSHFLYRNKVCTRYKYVRFLEFQFSLAGQNIKKLMSMSGNCRFIQLKRRLCLLGLICRLLKNIFIKVMPRFPWPHICICFCYLHLS